MNTCPHCGGELQATRKRKQTNGDGTVNPYGHPFPHARLYNVSLTPRLIGKQSWSPRMIPDSDPRNYPLTGKAPQP